MTLYDPNFTASGRDDLGHVLDVGDSDRPGRAFGTTQLFIMRIFQHPAGDFLGFFGIEMFNCSINLLILTHDDHDDRNHPMIAI